VSKDKKIRVREAKPRDLGLFRKLWVEFLKEQSEKGSFILNTEHNLRVYEAVFNLYTEKTIPGTVLFIAEDAVLMWGQAGKDELETDLGVIAQGWGTYIKADSRGKGYSKAIRAEGQKRLKELGFDTIVGTGLIDDSTALDSAFNHGWERHSVLGFYRLNKADEE